MKVAEEGRMTREMENGTRKREGERERMVREVWTNGAV